MTTAYSPARQWHAEDMLDAAINQLAGYQAELGPLREKYLDNWNADDAADLVGRVRECEQRILAAAEIVVRRHRLLQVV